METKLKNLKSFFSPNCISIILNTHRTFPDSQHDKILLKNLVKEAESRLLADNPKKEAIMLIEKINNLAESIDHRKNLESLILFVNNDIADFIRLPIAVENRVIIDNTFATRDLIRSLHQRANYLVLVLSKEVARLIEASDDKVIKEYEGVFPFINDFSKMAKAELSDAERIRNLSAEFFNQVDKAVNQLRRENPLPVMLVTDEQNFHEYMKITDDSDSIFNFFLSGNRQKDKDFSIVSDAWEVVKNHIIEQNNKRKEELKKAVSNNMFLSDINEIFQAIRQGKIQALFVEQGLFQPAIIENDTISYVDDSNRNDKDVIDDIYDELIEMNLKHRGEVVFLPKGELAKFNGFGAITRYR